MLYNATSEGVRRWLSGSQCAFQTGDVLSAILLLTLHLAVLMVRPAAGLGPAPAVLAVVCTAMVSTIIFVHHNQESEKEVSHGQASRFDKG